MKTAVLIPDSVFQAVERLAKSLGIPRSRLYTPAIERYVSEAQQRDVIARLNQVYAGEKGDLDPALAVLQWASVLREPWR
jgi:predicted transcriptional regulator